MAHDACHHALRGLQRCLLQIGTADGRNAEESVVRPPLYTVQRISPTAVGRSVQAASRRVGPRWLVRTVPGAVRPARWSRDAAPAQACHGIKPASHPRHQGQRSPGAAQKAAVGTRGLAMPRHGSPRRGSVAGASQRPSICTGSGRCRGPWRRACRFPGRSPMPLRRPCSQRRRGPASAGPPRCTTCGPRGGSMSAGGRNAKFRCQLMEPCLGQ